MDDCSVLERDAMNRTPCLATRTVKGQVLLSSGAMGEIFEPQRSKSGWAGVPGGV